MKIQLNYEDRAYFHPMPSEKMDKAIEAILEKFDWELDIPPKKNGVKELTRNEAKQLVEKGVRAAKRKKVRIYDTKVDDANRDIDYKLTI